MAELPQNKPFHSKLAFRIVVGIILVTVVTGALFLLAEMIEIEKRGSAPVTIGPTVDLAQGDEANATHAPSTIAVLNAWGREGAAAQVGDKLTQAGYKDVVAKNAPMQDYPSSTVLFRGNESKDSAEDIARIVGIETVDQLEDGSTWAQEYEIVVIIGQDAYGSVA